MKTKTALLAGASLLAMTAHAHALPGLGNLIISAFMSVGIGSLLTTGSAAAIGLTAIKTALFLGASAYSMIRAREPAADPNTLKQTQKGAEAPGRHAFGRVIVAGKVGFGNTAGYNIHRLVLHCFGPIDAVEEYFYDGRSVTVEEDGSVSSPPYSKPEGSDLYLRTKSGDGTETAWELLKEDFPDLWSDDHRAAGIGQTLLTLINPGTGSPRFAKILTGGVKEVSVKARVGRAYDPRTEETAWTRNGVLWCAHWISRLPGWSSAMLDWADIAERADEADELVPVVGGTAPRCTLSGGWEGPLTTDIVLEMLDSAGLEVRETEEGKYTFAWLEDDPASELVMPWSQEEDGIASPYIDHDLSFGPEGAKRPNICTLEYFSWERRYEIAEADLSEVAWARVDRDVDVYGDQERRIRLPFCDNVDQASRIARRMFYESRADAGLIKTTMAGLATWGKRVITVHVPDVGEDGATVSLKCRKGPVRVERPDSTCEIPITVIPPELQVPFDPETMTAEAPPILEAFEYKSSVPTPAAPVECVQVILPDSTPEIRIRYSSPVDDDDNPVSVDITEANRRSYGDGLPTQWASMEEYRGRDAEGLPPTPSTVWYAYSEADYDGLDADFRVRFFKTDDEGSEWSPLFEVRPVAIDNTPCPEPERIDDTDEFYTLELRASYATFWGFVPDLIDPPGEWHLLGSVPIRPEQVFEFVEGGTPPAGITRHRVVIHTSDGTSGTPYDWNVGP